MVPMWSYKSVDYMKSKGISTMNYKDEIMDRAAIRGIDSCVHFTNVTNLPKLKCPETLRNQTKSKNLTISSKKYAFNA